MNFRLLTITLLFALLAGSAATAQNRAPSTPTQRKLGAVKVPPPNTPMPAPSTASGTTSTSAGQGGKYIAPGLTGEPARQATADNDRLLRQPVPAPPLATPAAAPAAAPKKTQ
ncbi:hypothetical protein KBK19_18940 [Microvirga sp. STR05]|uniref:Uncharacterized protein n=1 Tax=Hymenobacter duratus TaxID=2771356 RepID=A0ABR8JJS6_9BACT|nr:hypothetical protein [Hymenobacter duratus]MBD2717127.1 hypothetical protein [Hymenobacter duratus]MBR7952043.1 hypothetical protein [Microvirga sp. STR05]